jgi:hypothetical protein
MRLGDRPDPGGDRARRLLHVFRGWIGRRGPRLALLALLILVAGGIGVAGGLAAAGFFGNLDNLAAGDAPAQAPTGLMRAIGVHPSDLLFILSGIRNVNIGLPAQFIQGALSDPKRVELDIAELDYQRLAYEREVALQQGLWLPSEEDYVPVTIRYDNRTLHGKARLKGDWPDHWYAEKWSLRFKLDGDDHLEHMREFALQAPRTRNYMAEWIFQQALLREGLSGLSYGFVDVTINGKPMGTYAIEEAFDEGITWYNRQPPGPLLRFTDTEYFETFAMTGYDMPDPHTTAALDAFGGNATKAGYSENETLAALRLLEQWRSGEISTGDAFDLDRTARYFALSDLLGNRHGDFYHNMRFYYNPIRARLEPVGHDPNAGEVIEEIRGETTDPYMRLFFDDPALTDRYLAELERISADGYLEALFAELEPGLQANVSIIYRDQPFYFLDRRPYFANRDLIRSTLHPYRAITAYVNGTPPAGPVVDLGASQPVPVEVTAVLAGGARAVPNGGPVRLPGKVLNEPVQYRTVAFTLPAGAAWNASTPLEVECRVVGATDLRLESVVSTPRLPGAAEAGALLRLPANTGSLPFAVTDDARRTVSLRPGHHLLVEPLVVPEGYTLRCGPNTSLDLVRNASIVARGPLVWAGTEDSPITVGSSDGTGGGVIVLDARNLSTLVDVRFGPLASTGAVREPRAAVTFLESPATLVRVSMNGDRSAPLLRLVRSPFNVSGSVFAGGSAPAVSVEYSTGAIRDTLIANGSGLRVAGSVVELERARFEEIPGTAVLVERVSTLSGAGVTCTAAGTALASESGSTAAVDGLTVRDADVAVRAARGEGGFAPGRVALGYADFSNVTTPYVQEDGGVIMVDGRRPEP